MAARHRSREKALQILYQWDMRRPQRKARAQDEESTQALEDSQDGEPEFTVQDAIKACYGSLAIQDGGAAPKEDLFSEELATGVVLKVDLIDPMIARFAKNWSLGRMSAVDRNILRLAVYEMKFIKTPPAIAIDEALLLAQRFSADESRAFINGILDSIRKQNNNS